MKRLTLILFLIFASCKNESKTETKAEMQTETATSNDIDKSVSKIWGDYIKSNPEAKDEEIPESDFFHNNREDADRLGKLTLTGKKKAFSGLYRLYKKYNADLPKAGTKQIITDFDGKALAIVQNISVDTVPFNKISKNYAAWDMGTNIEPLKKWKKAHWDFFEVALEEIGEQPTVEMPVVCVRFKTIWPKK